MKSVHEVRIGVERATFKNPLDPEVDFVCTRARHAAREFGLHALDTLSPQNADRVSTARRPWWLRMIFAH